MQFDPFSLDLDSPRLQVTIVGGKPAQQEKRLRDSVVELSSYQVVPT